MASRPRLLLLAVVLALCGCSAWGSHQATVPSQVREEIVRDYPRIAFLPGRLPSGYHYANWSNSADRSGYAVAFIHGPATNQLELSVQRRSCWRLPAKDTHTVHVNGHALEWLKSDNGPVAWRCLTNQGRSLMIVGSSAYESRQKVAELVGYASPAH